jgi:hypothetical protein
MSGWDTKPQVRYGGEDYMAREYRLEKAEYAQKEAYKKLSLWQKFKRKTYDIAFKIWTFVVLFYFWLGLITIPTTLAILFFILWLRK